VENLQVLPMPILVTTSSGVFEIVWVEFYTLELTCAVVLKS